MRISSSVFTGALGHVGFGSLWLGTGPTTNGRMNLPGKKEIAARLASWMLWGAFSHLLFPLLCCVFPGGPSFV